MGLRKRGEKLLHSKYVVILVIILTIVDCSLVIAELILDLYSVKKTLSATEGQTFKFMRSIRYKYPDEVRSNDSVFSVFDRITHATILWNNSKELDFHLRCYNLGTDSTTTSDTVMSFPSYSSFVPVRSSQEEAVDYYPQNTPSGTGGNSGAPSHRLRRAHGSRITSGDINSPQDNEEWIRVKTKNLFRRYVRRIRRYLPTTVNNNLFHNGVTTYDNNDDDANYGDNVYGNGGKNETIRLLDDMLVLHRQLSDYFYMQQRRSKSKRVEQDTVLPFGDSGIDTAVSEPSVSDIASVGVHIDGSDRSHEGVYITGGSVYSDVMLSHFLSEGYPDDSGVFEEGNEGDDEKRDARSIRSKRNSVDDVEANMRRELHHSKEMEIAHKLHYASVCVVSILVIEVTMKIACAGSHFLKRKIEVFDAVVIVTSVVVDLIFIKGLSEFAVDDSIFVLALLLPWRVIRVVNSLVMAVIDHEHVKLRLLYSRKKKLDKTVETLRNEVDELKGMLQDVRSFCIKEGIDSARIDGMLGKFAPRRRKDSKFYTLVKLVMSTASINNNDNESVSSSSIENDLRHYTNRDSVLNEVASNDGTITSLKGYLSVPFSNGDSRSASEAESIVGDHSNTSPSIYITSPASEDGMFTFCDVEIGDNDVFPRHDTSDCIEEEDSAATIDVTSNTTNINTMNGVAFYVGSQTSFNAGLFQGNMALAENDKTNNDALPGFSFNSALRETESSGSVDANKNVYDDHYQFGQYLTVPHCTLSVFPGTNTISISSNNDTGCIGGCLSTTTVVHSLPHGSCSYEMRRSASDNANVTLGVSHYDTFRRVMYGSPIPSRRLPEICTRRKTFSKRRSDSDDNSYVGLLKRDKKGRFRRNSGDPQATTVCGFEKNKRARSHSPSPMTLLSVPGNNKMGSDVTCSSSRSMNDVSSAGNPCGIKLAEDGKILRRSCLSLNSEGRKRRGKSPHRNQDTLDRPICSLSISEDEEK